MRTYKYVPLLTGLAIIGVQAQTIDVRAYKTRFSDVMNTIAEKSKKKIKLETDENPLISIGAKDLSLNDTLKRISNLYGFEFEVKGDEIIAKSKAVATDTKKEERGLASTPEEGEALKELSPMELRAEGYRYHRITVGFADMSFIQKQIENILGPKMSKYLSTDSKANAFILYGDDETKRLVQQIIDDIDISPPQVLLSAKVVELTKSFARDMGLQLTRTPGTSKGNIEISNPTGASNIKLGYKFGIIDAVGLDATLAAGESDGNAKIISNPQIVTGDNTLATLDSGISFSVRVSNAASGSSGVVAGGLEKVTAGLKLSVKPKVLRDGRIKLEIDINSSSPDKASSVDNIPGIIQTAVKTEMIVRQGQTATIAGLYKHTSTEGGSGVPLLKNIPIFGYLFKNDSVDKKRQEIMAFITPSVIEGLNDRSITLRPSDGDDLDVILKKK